MLKVIYDTFSFTFSDLVIRRLLERHKWYPKLISQVILNFLLKASLTQMLLTILRQEEVTMIIIKEHDL